ncbi:MAG TPA: M12 family metallo-peptidase [Steroidobacteraceae bacterium]|nr:M12 family metallo-peptidase [Steroidobacteraceae bacterium]
MRLGQVAGAAVRAGLWVVAIATLAPCVAAASDGAQPAHITYFEPLRLLPSATSSAGQKSGAGLQQLRFDAFGRRFEISLGLNTRLMASKPEQSSLQLYRGSIDGMPGSWVRLAMKGEAVHGMMWDGSQLYAIEPASEVSDSLDSPPADASRTVVFRLADAKMDAGAAACGSESAPVKASDAYDELTTELKSTTVAMQAVGATRRLDVSALGDAHFFYRYGNEKDARDAILTRLNNVDGIYSSQLAIEIHVGTLSVPDAEHDQLSLATDPKSLLRDLANLRKRSADLNSQGVTHLFTDRELDGSTIGIAYLDSLCDKQNAVGLTESRNVWLDSLVAAHELGHNFGADHDGAQDGSCPNTPSSGFLMAPVVSGTDDFSACSLTRMRQGAQHASCITNLPPANVRISNSLGSLRAPLDTPFAWQMYVMNAGGLTARDVRAELALPADLTVVDASVIGGSCTSGGGTVQCELGELAGGSSRAVDLQLRGDVAGTNTITAQVSADKDANRRDNEGSGTVIIEAPADVSVTLQGPTTATANKAFTVGFQIANSAADNAGAVTVQIDIPAGTTVGSASLVNGSCTTGAAQIECTVAPLGPGIAASGSVSLMASAAGSATLRAAVSGDYYDSNSANDTAELVVAVSSASSPATAEPPSSGGGGGGGGGGSFGLLLLLALAPLQYPRHRRA